MNTMFTPTVDNADGRYLTDAELQVLEQYVQTYRTRKQTYQILSVKANDLVLQSLKQLAMTHRKEVQTYGGKCRRDMTYTLQYIARAVLMDEAETFREGFAVWMENITRAVHKGDSAARACRCLKTEVQKALPVECSALVVPYIDDLITAFSNSMI